MTGRPCPFGDTEHTRERRHDHPYRLGEYGRRQCGCGSRRWKLTVHPIIGFTVACERCGQNNVTATAYERGRDAGQRVRVVAGDRAPF